jgi:Flp pilus assembly protein TadG
MILGRRRRSRGRGQNLVEFALILPVFLLLLVGIFDFGRAIYAYNTVNNAAREGGRLAITDQTLTDIQSHAAQHAASLQVADTDVYVDYRAQATPDVESSCDALIGTDAAVGCLAVVRVPYTYNAATPLIGNLVGPLLVTGETRFRVEFNCVDNLPTLDCPLGD